MSQKYIAKGIDVSSWQRGMNYKKPVAAGVQFAICRASFGWMQGQKDNAFEEHIKGFQSLKIPCGAYHYSYATTVDEAEKEANYFLSCIKGHKLELPVYYDMEDACQAKLSRELLPKPQLCENQNRQPADNGDYLI